MLDNYIFEGYNDALSKKPFKEFKSNSANICYERGRQFAIIVGNKYINDNLFSDEAKKEYRYFLKKKVIL